MSNSQPTYYELLGVSPSASQDTVKKRYRELARKYHPDVNPMPEAAQQIKVINEAYHTLGDTDKRQVYDANLALMRKAAADRDESKARPPQTNNPPHSPQRSSTPPSAGYNGFGTTRPDPFPEADRTRPRPANNASSQAQNNTSGQNSNTSRKATAAFNTADRLLAEAKLAFINHRYDTAENLCQQALMIDRRNAVAHEILGDIYLKKRQRDRAGTAYSYSIQFNPRNYSVQAKLESLGATGYNQRQSSGSAAHTVSPGGWRFPINFEHDLIGIVLTVVLSVMLLASGIVLWNVPGEVIFSGFSFNFFIAAALAGICAGGLMALYAGLRPLKEELFRREQRPDGQPITANVGSVLIISSLLWFYASLLLYIGIAAPRGRLSSSVIRIYGCVIVLTILSALIYQTKDGATGLSIAALSGNILFPACVLGWALGDSFRLKA